MKPSRLLAEAPVMLHVKGCMVEMSSSVSDGPPLIQLVKTPSKAHATCAICACVLRRGLFVAGTALWDPPRA